jgi:hypothetical protein
MEPMKPMKSMQPMEPMKPMEPMGSGPKWWPNDLGAPASCGSQNDVRYAFFPSSRRLAIEESGKVTVYDSGDHQISGVSQQQGSDRTLAFTSQKGDVKTNELKKV